MRTRSLMLSAGQSAACACRGGQAHPRRIVSSPNAKGATNMAAPLLDIFACKPAVLISVTLAELVNAAASVNHFLLAGIERVAL